LIFLLQMYKIFFYEKWQGALHKLIVCCQHLLLLLVTPYVCMYKTAVKFQRLKSGKMESAEILLNSSHFCQVCSVNTW